MRKLKIKFQHKKVNLTQTSALTMKDYLLVGQVFIQLAVLLRVNHVIEQTNNNIKYTLHSMEKLSQLNEKFLLEFSDLVAKAFSLNNLQEAALVSSKLVEHEDNLVLIKGAENVSETSSLIPFLGDGFTLMIISLALFGCYVYAKSFSSNMSDSGDDIGQEIFSDLASATFDTNSLVVLGEQSAPVVNKLSNFFNLFSNSFFGFFVYEEVIFINKSSGLPYSESDKFTLDLNLLDKEKFDKRITCPPQK